MIYNIMITFPASYGLWIECRSFSSTGSPSEPCIEPFSDSLKSIFSYLQLQSSPLKPLTTVE